MKKIIVLLFLATLVATGVFAQGNETKSANARLNWASGQLSILGVGARYERMLNERWSIGANASLNTYILFTDYDVSVVGRFYPWGKTFFAGIGVGFHVQELLPLFVGEDGKAYSVTGVAITPELGWKIDIGNTGGFFLSPGVKFPLTFGAASDGSGFMMAMPLPVIYLGLGYAF